MGNKDVSVGVFAVIFTEWKSSPAKQNHLSFTRLLTNDNVNKEKIMYRLTSLRKGGKRYSFGQINEISFRLSNAWANENALN